MDVPLQMVASSVREAVRSHSLNRWSGLDRSICWLRMRLEGTPQLPSPFQLSVDPLCPTEAAGEEMVGLRIFELPTHGLGIHPRPCPAVCIQPFRFGTRGSQSGE
jgi:hypothetical protein